MSHQVTRREFLGTGGKTAAGVAAGLALHGLLREARAAEAKDKFNVALVGCGGMGRYKLNNFVDSKQVNVVAVCDIDDAQSAMAIKSIADRNPQTPKVFKDYRKVVDMKDIDLVIVATPDHWHAPVMMSAVANGKDVYCEKPCSHNIREARAMLNAAKKYNRVVQVGTHQREIPHIQRARELLQSGGLGKVSMTQTFTYGNEAPTGMGNAPDEAVPAGVDYNTWLGAAPERPFNRRRFHNSWRWYFDYAAGMVGDWNVHLQDIVMWSMGAKFPVSVSCVGGKYALEDDRDTPDTMQAVYEFPDFIQTYTMHKASGKPWNAGGYGMDFHGTNGYLHLTRDHFLLDPDRKDWTDPKSEFRTKAEDTRYPTADGDAHAAHVKNFLECVRSRKAPLASIDQHFFTVTACHLANVSLRAGHKVFWDHEKELCFADKGLKHEDKEANKFLTREYRKGFELPNV
jgi:predicted dehydrogenase